MEKQLVYYGGNGFDGVPEIGKFEVKANETLKFISLSKAKEHYDLISGQEKSIWNISNTPELLEAHVFE